MNHLNLQSQPPKPQRSSSPLSTAKASEKAVFSFNRRSFSEGGLLSPLSSLLLLLLLGSNLKAQTTYQVNPNGSGDYTTIQAAFDKLNQTTVTGDVIIEIASGTYDEELELHHISNNNASITVQSASGKASDVVLVNSAVANQFNSDLTIRVVDQVIFQNLTLSSSVNKSYALVNIGDSTGTIQFNGVDFKKGANVSKDQYAFYEYIDLTNFQFGGTCDHLVVSNSTIDDLLPFLAGLYGFEFDQITFRNNEVSNTRTTTWNTNHLVLEQSTFNNATIGMVTAKTFKIDRNEVWFNGSSDLLSINRSGDTFSTGSITNNIFLHTGYSSVITVFDNKNRLDIANNTIHVKRDNCVLFNMDVDSVSLYNNVFSGTDNDAYGLHFFDSVTYELNTFNCDHNDYYFPNSHAWYREDFNYFIEEKLNLQQIQSKHSFETNGLSVDPIFQSASNLRTSNALLKNAGKKLSYVSEDIDGEDRSDGHDIGANEIIGNINLAAKRIFNIIGTLEAGKQIQLEYEVENMGSLGVNYSWVDRIFLSKDDQIDEDDIQLKSLDIQLNLKANQTYSRKESVSLPYVPGGTYYFIVSTNHLSDSFESSYSDNRVASSQLTFNAPKLADLEVTSVVTPSSQFSGKSFELEWTVKNSGSTTTPGTWTDAIYAANSLQVLNDPRNLVNDSLLIVSRPAPKSLQPGESYTNKWSVNIPLRYSGKIYYRVQTNSGAAFFEVDTTYSSNGKNSAAVNVTQSPLPDLVMTSLNTPNITFSGATVGINWTVKNQGQQKTFRTSRQIFERNWLNRVNFNYWTDRIYLSRKPFYDEDEPSQRLIASYYRPDEELDKADSYTHMDSIRFGQCDYGKYYIIGIANEDYFTYELTYENNVGPLDSIEVIIDPVPDLKPTTLNVTNSPSSGQEIAISYRVLNDGFSTKPMRRSNDHFYLSLLDTFNPDESIYLGFYSHDDSLEVDDSYSPTVQFEVPFDVFGTYYLYVAADFTDNICEANLNNNNTLRTASPITISLSPQPDLFPDFLEVPDTVTAGSTYTLIKRVTNQGQGDAVQSNWQDVLEIGNNELNVHYQNAILASGFSYNDTVVVQIPIDLEEGNHPLKFTTDPENDLFEIGFESNNTATHSIYVKRDLDQVPDLAISQLSVNNSGNLSAGEEITLEYQLSNTSKSTNVSGWEDRVRITDGNNSVHFTKKIKHVGGIMKGESRTIERKIKLPYTLNGTYTIEYTVNSKPSIVEYITSNNQDDLSVSVKAYNPPDLEITSVQFDECCQKYALQEDTFQISIRNNGPGNLDNRTIMLRVFLAKDQLGNDASSTVSIPVRLTIQNGSESTVKVPVKWDYAAEGDYYIIGIVDSENDVYEGLNENNNQYVSAYTINVDNEPIQLYPSALTVKSTTNPMSDFLRVEYTVTKGANQVLKRHIDDRLVLSQDRELNSVDIQFGATSPTLRNLSASTTTYSGELFGSIPNSLQPGWYFIGVNIDGFNTVLEVDETNNVLWTADSFWIDNTISLTLDQQKGGSFYEGTINGREYFKLDRPKDKGMIVELEFENKQVSSELYHRISAIPTDAVYDNKFNNPFLSDQEVLVPVTDTATRDFLFLKANKVPWVNSNPIDYSCFLGSTGGGGAVIIRPFFCSKPDTVEYSIIARSAEYSIHKVSPDSGSVHGAISLLIQGFDFDDSTEFYLVNGTDTLWPMQQEVISSLEAAIHVDLREAALANYTAVAAKANGEVVQLQNGFTVFDGAPEEPFVNIHANSAQRVLVGHNAQVTIDFGNRGYADGHDYWLWVAFSNENFNTSTLSTTYIGSSEEDAYDQLDEHPNPPNDSGYVDVDGMRYYLYWIPVLPANGLTTFTFNFSSSIEEHILVQAELVPQPLSEYSASQHIGSFDQSASFYKLMHAAQQVDFQKLGKKGGFDCDNIDVANVEKELLKQTWAVGQKVHGGAKTYAGANSLRSAFKKAVKTKLVDPAKDAVTPSKIKENTIKAAKDKGNLKKLINYEKPMTDRLKDYATSVYEAGSPIENLKKITEPDDPPFKDLLNNTFDCIDFGKVEKKFENCTYETRVSDVEKQKFGIKADYKRRVKESCREDFGLPPKNKDKDNAITRFVKSLDPNEIVGPEGVTDAQLVQKDEVLQYTIFFENVSTAGAPARFVAINNPLPDGLRPQSFRLISYGFGDTILYLPETNSVNQTIHLDKRYNNQHLNLVAGIDVISNTAFWRFTTIDARTGNMVVSPFDGFLPPNDSTQIGQGFVTYEIEIDGNTAAGTEINNSADIIFDQNAVIPTNVWSNIVMSSSAESEVEDLPAESPSEFKVNWTGTSGTNGSGIQNIDVYVSKDAGEYALWLQADQPGSASFLGEAGSTYRFYSQLTTLDGKVEYAPTMADAVTTVEDTVASVRTQPDGAQSGLARVYPNPNRGLFTVEVPGSDRISWKVFNLSGQVLTENHQSPSKTIIDLSNQPAGIYFLWVSDGLKHEFVRIMKE